MNNNKTNEKYIFFPHKSAIKESYAMDKANNVGFCFRVGYTFVLWTSEFKKIK